MANGIALTIGLNSVNPEHYAGWSGELIACEADAQDMANIAKSKGFQVKTLLTKEATRDRVVDEIARAANTLNSGDIFMISYSGHGGQVPDLSGDESDLRDETWCLYDGQYVDDELYSLYCKFAPGVRILALYDSCHSGAGTLSHFYASPSIWKGDASREEIKDNYTKNARIKSMPYAIGIRVYRTNREFYDKIQKNPANKKQIEAPVKASIIIFGGCQDNQVSRDGDFNGLFTSQLLFVWNQGQFKGNYRQFFKRVRRLMPMYQNPKYYLVGKENKNFEAQSPFTI